ncbi:uncharacterized protein LOC143371765 [Andrena cerasifolii]|uniref:uncharacterized protein LOC143371765 n=1 Tax=Andrena cerasifolii TaxID=2819439 RepID=UPI004037DFC1
MSFHEFNQFTGRLKQSTQTQALHPVSPRPLQATEPIMIYDSIKTKPVGTSPAQASYSTLSPRMAALYKKYQADLTKPSYMLGGKRDKVLMAVTVALTGALALSNMYYVIKTEKK